MTPNFENATQMEAAAAGEDDDTASLLLRRRMSESNHPSAKQWLRVVWYSTGCKFYLDGKRSHEVTRCLAQQLIDDEWGR